MKTAEGGEWTHFGKFDNDDPNGEDVTNPGDIPEFEGDDVQRPVLRILAAHLATG